jgi:glutamine cyclotransferase
MAVIRLFCALLVASSVAVGALPAPSARAATSDRWSIIHVYPHKSGAWTEGLVFRKGVLYESTGLYGRSSLRRVDLATGNVLQIRHLSDSVFGEGMTFIGGKAWVLTWKENRVLLFDPSSFARVGRFNYAGEGWGLTDNGTSLVMSNGTNRIRFRDPTTFSVTRSIDVTEAGQPVDRLNELEWINGRIWANIWLLPSIVVIDPSNGNVVDRIDFSALLDMEKAIGDPRDMNGIAYMKSQGRLFVTGKFWKHVYEVRVTAP